MFEELLSSHIARVPIGCGAQFPGGPERRCGNEPPAPTLLARARRRIDELDATRAGIDIRFPGPAHTAGRHSRGEHERREGRHDSITCAPREAMSMAGHHRQYPY